MAQMKTIELTEGEIEYIRMLIRYDESPYRSRHESTYMKFGHSVTFTTEEKDMLILSLADNLQPGSKLLELAKRINQS